jgi:hypothetical protein
VSTFCTCLDEFGTNPPDDPCALHGADTACPNGDEDCPTEYLCAECYQDGKEQAAIDAEDARQGR